MDNDKLVRRYYKKISETPLEALNRFRVDFPEFEQSKLAYAGRLDPQAHGELLILIDEECKNRDHYQNLDKVYEFEVLPGLLTDTGDIMGLLLNYRFQNIAENDSNFEQKIADLIGEVELPYPTYSSKAVDGKPLWKWAREERLDEINIPKKTSTVYELSYLEKRMININQLEAEVVSRIKKVTGDFRQTEILHRWDQVFTNTPLTEILLYKFRAKVSSGTYIRSLAQEIMSPALCFDIERIEVLIID